MRTIFNLLELDGDVYVYLKNEEIGHHFMQAAELEGFSFGDGVKPTARQYDDILTIKKDKTLCYVGYAGHMAFYTVKASSLVPKT